MPVIPGTQTLLDISTDYPLDKVVYQQKVTFPIAAFDFTDVIITHNLGFMPLVSAQWALNANFTPSYNISGGPYSTPPSRSYGTTISADTTKVYLSTTNTTGSPINMWANIYGLMPSNVNADPPWDSDFAGDDFIINSDYNYTKLLSAGIVPGVITPAFGSVEVKVPHNLGYYPQVSCWRQTVSNGRTSPVIINRATGAGVPIQFNAVNVDVTTTDLVVTYYDTISLQDVHYRIYADEQLA